jgi:hypothetical protein
MRKALISEGVNTVCKDVENKRLYLGKFQNNVSLKTLSNNIVIVGNVYTVHMGAKV